MRPYSVTLFCGNKDYFYIFYSVFMGNISEDARNFWHTQETFFFYFSDPKRIEYLHSDSGSLLCNLINFLFSYVEKSININKKMIK